MVRAALTALLLTAALPGMAADYGPGSPVRRHEGAALDYALKCKGCHGLWGQGTPGHVPRLDGFVGLFTHLPDGRDYLMRVPGVARSVLDDARLTAVLNWVLDTYGATTRAPDFPPFTVEEVAAARLRPLEDRKARRDRMLAELRGRGLLAPDDDGIGVSPEPRG